MPNVLTGVLSGTSSIIRTQPLTATENGTYNPPSGVDGYKPVVVNVPQPQPVIEQLTATYNGIYNAPSGVDGYNPVVVNVPAPAPVLDDITITENGHYVPPTGVDGYDDITVNVPAPAPVLDDITITANGHYAPPTGVDGYDDITVNVPLPSNAYLKQTLSGLPSPIATFTGADAPLDSLKASIVGVQDLHGYDKPWPAGGGKNKFNKNGSLENNKFIQADGTLVTSPNWNTTDYQQITPNIYTMSGATGGAGGYYGICWYDSEKTYISGFQKFTTSPQTVTIPSNAQYVRYSVNNSALDSFMLEQGTTATSYEPYENICPISGWTSCEVTDNNNTYTIPFKDSSDNPITVYDGGIDVSGGKLTVTHANIASYNGETINEPWISSEDVYTQGATPTTGAQVVYPLTTPLVYDFDPIALRSNGVTNISVDCGEVTECKYFTQS